MKDQDLKKLCVWWGQGGGGRGVKGQGGGGRGVKGQGG